MDFDKWSCNKRSEEIYMFGNSDIRRWYQRDIDQIVHSTAFRKLQRKSQLLSEHDPRSRSRLIHTIEVSRIALEISEKLGLSKELTEAISMGHDIATSPYGFVGNDFLRHKAKARRSTHVYTHEEAGASMLETISQKKLVDTHMINSAANAFQNAHGSSAILNSGWREINVSHFPHSLWVSRRKQEEGKFSYYGYFISPEVIDGVRNHGGRGKPNSLEGQVVQFSDNIAYLSQDLDDLMYAHIISSPEEYTRFEANQVLENGGMSMEWSDIDCWKELGKKASPSLKDVFNRSRGIRISTLITRFVDYNKEMINKNLLKFQKSTVLGIDIPVLQCDEGLQFVLNFLWKYIEGFYTSELIKTSNCLQLSKLQQVWSIINDDNFAKRNKSYRQFNEKLKDSRFQQRSLQWKRGYFISHLSWNDIDIIINSFHRRDYSFEIDLEEGGNENN